MTFKNYHNIKVYNRFDVEYEIKQNENGWVLYNHFKKYSRMITYLEMERFCCEMLDRLRVLEVDD